MAHRHRHNLTVADIHTYYVLFEEPVLVHDTQGCREVASTSVNGARTRRAQRQAAHRRGFEARRGFGYMYSVLQTIKNHRLQHKYGGYR